MHSIVGDLVLTFVVICFGVYFNIYSVSKSNLISSWSCFILHRFSYISVHIWSSFKHVIFAVLFYILVHLSLCSSDCNMVVINSSLQASCVFFWKVSEV